jgi:hypothetical protein
MPVIQQTLQLRRLSDLFPLVSCWHDVIVDFEVAAQCRGHAISPT